MMRSISDQGESQLKRAGADTMKVLRSTHDIGQILLAESSTAGSPVKVTPKSFASFSGNSGLREDPKSGDGACRIKKP